MADALIIKKQVYHFKVEVDLLIFLMGAFSFYGLKCSNKGKSKKLENTKCFLVMYMFHVPALLRIASFLLWNLLLF